MLHPLNVSVFVLENLFQSLVDLGRKLLGTVLIQMLFASNNVQLHFLVDLPGSGVRRPCHPILAEEDLALIHNLLSLLGLFSCDPGLSTEDVVILSSM
jgi:hypothetical protein